MVLRYFVGKVGKPIAELKRSGVARLLGKPAVRDYLARLGQPRLTAPVADGLWPSDPEAFILTVGQWGARNCSWSQTTRRGYNAVLQRNFPEKHNRLYRRLVKPRVDGLFNGACHPVLERGTRRYFRETLAWARIDVSFATDEALIEEIQTDWVRGAHRALRFAERYPNAFERRWRADGDKADLTRYVQEVLPAYADMWDEAMLTAAITFIREELGIRNIFYHTFETGNAVKRIRDAYPPRSLYTTLPQRFCFSEVSEIPRFLENEKVLRKSLKKVTSPSWFRMAF